ncbi:MAG: acyl transferase [Flavobacteriales bacterium]
MANIFNHIDTLFSIENEGQLAELAIELFNYQYNHTAIYHNYVNHLKIAPASIKSPEKIPFLPIRFFKTHRVIKDFAQSEITFQSSGTTGMAASRHDVADLALYRRSFTQGFEHFYGNPSQFCFLALLPSYLERENSSLVFMMRDLILATKHLGSGFYLHDYAELNQKLRLNEEKGIPTILIGVTFAMLDFAAQYPGKLISTIVMETGGMKGRREEMTRSEVHQVLQDSFGLEVIHSEYGMTELLSQAYSQGKGLFRCPPWMKFCVRETADPLAVAGFGRGGINIIDLANVNSCSFIATDDLGIIHLDGSFEITGRYDHADVRGCNLMVV